MAEWLYEAGIGEARAALIDDDCIVEAHIEPERGGIRVGAIVEGRLAEILVPHRRGVVVLADGTELLVEPLARDWTDGASVRVEVVRERIGESGRSKRAKARPADRTPQTGPDLYTRIVASGIPVRTLHRHESDALEAAGWTELLECAASGLFAFSGGMLRIEGTAAMTVIDVDGYLPPAPLGIAAAGAAATAIRACAISGSIGIDFPTVDSRADRLAIADAFDRALPLPFERTAVNGFGFMQIVRPRYRASLIEQMRADPVGHATRALLRRAERSGIVGASRLVAPAAIAVLLEQQPHWVNALARILGGTIGLRSDAALSMSGAYVETA